LPTRRRRGRGYGRRRGRHRRERDAADDPGGAQRPDPIYVSAAASGGSARPAPRAKGGVAGADLEIRPLLRPGELLEATPGLIATQHSGGGKANQFFLRGFNLDHGTDFALYIDDFPVNFRTHGHGQGYLDVNGLIPEAVERVDYRKGPYRADAGDFSFVGSAQITTRDTMRPFALVEGGQYGYHRFVAEDRPRSAAATCC
jgi:outer membrane receptor protein involved in Fe transport